MKYRELTRKLRRMGCELDRRAKGDHEIWIRLSTHGRTTIPNWGSRDLRPGTIGAILRDLHISRAEFEQAWWQRHASDYGIIAEDIDHELGVFEEYAA